jgi:hypothetical protein
MLCLPRIYHPISPPIYHTHTAFIRESDKYVVGSTSWWAGRHREGYGARCAGDTASCSREVDWHCILHSVYALTKYKRAMWLHLHLGSGFGPCCKLARQHMKDCRDQLPIVSWTPIILLQCALGSRAVSSFKRTLEDFRGCSCDELARAGRLAVVGRNRVVARLPHSD